MRMSGFLIGGVLGAAAAMYFSRNNRPMMLSNVNWDQAVDKAGQFVRTAKTMWDTATTMTANNTNAGNNANAGNTGTNTKSAGGLDNVGKMIGQDAAVQQQVNEIMKENGGQTIHS